MLGDRRRSFGVVGADPDPTPAGDFERAVQLVEAFSNPANTTELLAKAKEAQRTIDEAKAAEARLAELKEQHAAVEAAHRAQLDDRRGQLSEEIRQGRAEIEADKKAAAELKTQAEADRAAAAKDKAEAARRLRVMSGEAA